MERPYPSSSRPVWDRPDSTTSLPGASYLAAQRQTRQRFPLTAGQQAPALMMPRRAVRSPLLWRVPDQYEFQPHRLIRIRR